MLTSCPDVPRAIFTQINVAIIKKSIFRYISVNNADNWTNKVSDPCFDGQRSLKYHSWSDHVCSRHANMQIA